MESLISTVFLVSICRSEAPHDSLAISEALGEQLKGRRTISGLTYHRATLCA